MRYDARLSVILKGKVFIESSSSLLRLLVVIHDEVTYERRGILR